MAMWATESAVITRLLSARQVVICPRCVSESVLRYAQIIRHLLILGIVLRLSLSRVWFFLRFLPRLSA